MFGITFLVLWVATAISLFVLVKKKLIRIALLVKAFELIFCALVYGYLASKANPIFFCLPSIVIINVLIGILFVK